MRIYYIDESEGPRYYVRSALGVDAERWNGLHGRIQDWRRALAGDYSVPTSRELHACDLLAGRGKLARIDNTGRRLSPEQGAEIFMDGLRIIENAAHSLGGIEVVNVCLRKADVKGYEQVSLDRLLNRINTSVAADGRYAHLIFDEGGEHMVRRLYGRLRSRNPVPSRYEVWEDGEPTKDIPIERIIGGPSFRSSQDDDLLGFWKEGRLIHRETGMPRLMQFADDMPGVPLQDLWDDIPPVLGNERVGYPTQKPLALLERVIRASSNEGGLVLDPFCGCATACVAAENLGRRWIGIDISPKAVELVNVRLQSSMGSLFHNRLVTARTDIPRRTDIDAPIPYRQNKHVLFGQQEGRCNGCKSAFEFRHLEVDHIIPQNAGGHDHIDNLQLLCGHCNRVKGNRPQEYLMVRLRELGISPR